MTPVWTLFQLSSEASEAGNSPEFDEELLPSALRNMKVMRAYIKEALFFSENLRPDIQLGRLDMIVKQAAELGRASRKKYVDEDIASPFSRSFAVMKVSTEASPEAAASGLKLQ